MAPYELWAIDPVGEQACVLDESGHWMLLLGDNEWKPQVLNESDVMRWALSVPAQRRHRYFSSLEELVTAVRAEVEKGLETPEVPSVEITVSRWPDYMFMPADVWTPEDRRGRFFWAYLFELALRFPPPWESPLPGWEHLSAQPSRDLDKMARTERQIQLRRNAQAVLYVDQDNLAVDDVWMSSDKYPMANWRFMSALWTVLDWMSRTLQSPEDTVSRNVTTQRLATQWIQLQQAVIHSTPSYTGKIINAAKCKAIAEAHARLLRTDFDTFLRSLTLDRATVVGELQELYSTIETYTEEQRDHSIRALCGEHIDATPLLVVAEIERLLAFEAQTAIEQAIRNWYPAYRIHGRHTTITSNIFARLLAWQTIATSLATRLELLWSGVDFGHVAHEQAIVEARTVVSQAVPQLWPAATFIPRPFLTPVAFAVEFETYRYGAIFLAEQLSQIYARCLALHEQQPHAQREVLDWLIQRQSLGKQA